MLQTCSCKHTQDLDHPLNADPDCAYSPLETALGRLEALTDIPALAHTRHAEIYAARDVYGRCAARRAPPLHLAQLLDFRAELWRLPR